jgi:uncharacterized RDD family membrane protein YckC
MTHFEPSELFVNPSGAATHRLATPGERLGAYLLDFMLVIVTVGIGWLIWSIVVWQRATTPGHSLLNHVFVDSSTGHALSWGRTALREVIWKGLVGGVASWLSAGIYFVVDSLFVIRTDRRTIHDMLASSTVIVVK